MTVYENNDVLIETVRVDEYEHKVNVNGKNLMWISSDDVQKFRVEMADLLNKYRI